MIQPRTLDLEAIMARESQQTFKPMTDEDGGRVNLNWNLRAPQEVLKIRELGSPLPDSFTD